MWRWWDRREKAEAIFSLIRQYYLLDGPPTFTATSPVFSSWGAYSTNTEDDTVHIHESSDEELSTPSTSVAVTSSATDEPSTSAPIACCSATVTADPATTELSSGVPLSVVRTTTSTSEPVPVTSNVTFKKANRLTVISYTTKCYY